MKIDYRCEPYGAKIVESGNIIASCPNSIEYKVKSEDRERGFIEIGPLTAVWPSGASATTSQTRFYISKGSQQTFSFIRPFDNAEAYRYDQEYGARKRQMDIDNAIRGFQMIQGIRQQQLQQQQMLQQRQQQNQNMQNAPRSGSGSVTDVNTGKTYDYQWRTN